MAKLTTAVRLSRLRHWREIMKAVAADPHKREHFDMRVWGRTNRDAPFEEVLNSTTPHQHECGTAACAAGWAASDPRFIRAGFKMRVGTTLAGRPEKYSFSPVFGLERGIHAVGRFFGTDYYQTDRITTAEQRDGTKLRSEPVTVEQVIARINTVIREVALEARRNKARLHKSRRIRIRLRARR